MYTKTIKNSKYHQTEINTANYIVILSKRPYNKFSVLTVGVKIS